uniref:Uncharacterized protein n=1 Tax=Romanomermis culicivorax TaxID=13658 RepID=A0A915I8D2_ROMCU
RIYFFASERKSVKTKLALEDACSQATSEEEICPANDERKIFDIGSNFQAIKEDLASLDLKSLESKLETYKLKAGAICKQTAQRFSDATSNTAGAGKSVIPRAVLFHDNHLSNNFASARKDDGHYPSLFLSGSIDKRDVAKKPRLYYNAKRNTACASDHKEKIVAEESNDARVRRIRAGVSSADDLNSHGDERSNQSQASSTPLNTTLLEKPNSTHLSVKSPVNSTPAVEGSLGKLILEKRPRMRHHLRKYEIRNESSSSDEKECKLKSRQRNDKDLAHYIHRKRIERRHKAEKKEGSTEENIEKRRYYDPSLVRKLIEQRKLYLSKEKLLAKKLKEQEKLILQENIRNILGVQRERRRQPFVELYLNVKKARINIYDSRNGSSSNEHFVEDLKKRYELKSQDEVQQLPNQNSEDVGQKTDSLQSSNSGRLRGAAGHVPVPKLNLTSLFEDSPPSINQEFDHSQPPVQAIEKHSECLPRAVTPSSTSSSDSIVQKRIFHRQQVINSNKSSLETPNPPPSVSSLSLITPPDNRTLSIDYNGRFSCEKMPGVNSVNGNSSFSSQKDFTPKTLQVQVNAGLNYLNFIHDSIDQVKDIEVAANAIENSAIPDEKWTTSDKKVDIEKPVFIEHSLLAQMTETQKLLYETIRSTNEHLENSRLLLKSENIVEIAAKTAEVVASSFLNAQTPGRLTVSSEHQLKKSKERPSKIPSKILTASIDVNLEKGHDASMNHSGAAAISNDLPDCSKKLFKSKGTSQEPDVRIRSFSVRPQKTDSSFVNDGSSSSFSITDRTERESKLRALRSSLKEKKQLADKLKQEYKRRTNEKFRLTEESLKKQVQMYDEHIKELKTQMDTIEKEPFSNSSTWKQPTSPRIMSPRLGSTPQSCRLSNGAETERTLTPTSLLSEKSRSKSMTQMSRKSSVSKEANNHGDQRTSTNPSVADKISNSASTKNAVPSISSSKSKFLIDSIGKSLSVSQQIFGENDRIHIETAEIETTDEVSDVPEEETINEERSLSDHISKTLQIESNHMDMTTKLDCSPVRGSLKDCLKVIIDINSIKQPVERSISPSTSPRSPSVSKYVSEIYRFPDNDRFQQPLKSPRSLILPKLDLDQVDLITESTLHLEQDDFLVDSFEECSSTKPAVNVKLLGDVASKQITPLALTTDVFAAIPLGRNQHEILVNAILDQLYESRRCGEPISNAVALQAYYNMPLENVKNMLDLNQ